MEKKLSSSNHYREGIAFIWKTAFHNYNILSFFLRVGLETAFIDHLLLCRVSRMMDDIPMPLFNNIDQWASPEINAPTNSIQANE